MIAGTVADWRPGYLQCDTITWFRGMFERKASTTKDTKVRKGIQAATVTPARPCSTMRRFQAIQAQCHVAKNG